VVRRRQTAGRHWKVHIIGAGGGGLPPTDNIGRAAVGPVQACRTATHLLSEARRIRTKTDRLHWPDGPGTQMVHACPNRSDRTRAPAAHSLAVRCNRTDLRGPVHPLPKFGPSLHRPRQCARLPNYLGGPPASGTQATLLPPKTLAQNLSGSNGSERDGSRRQCCHRAYRR
jgi:hypothetical protein